MVAVGKLDGKVFSFFVFFAFCAKNGSACEGGINHPRILHGLGRAG